MATASTNEATAAATRGDRAARSAALRTVLRVATQPPVVGTLLLVPSLVWVSLDRSIWPWDPAWYGEVSVDLWSTLRLHPDEWLSLMANAFGSKPPAIAWFGQFFVPFGDVLGNIEVALLVSVVVCQIASVALVFASVRRLTNRLLPALCAAVLLAGAPLFTALSHEYFADPIAALAVCWVLFVMASADRWPLALVLTNLTAGLAFGLLAKLSTPLFMAAPAAAAVLIAWRSRTQRGDERPFRRDRALVVSSIAAGALVLGALAWYRNNLSLALEHARTVNSPLYGRELPYTTQLDFWSSALLDATFLPYFAALVAVVLGIGLLPTALPRSLRLRLPAADLLCLLACVATAVAVLLVISRQLAQETRYLLPLVAVVALGFGIVVGRLRHGVVAVAVLVLVSVQFVVSTLQSFGADVGSLAYARIRAPVDDRFQHTLERIVHTTCTPGANGRISLVGVDYPWLNANTLALIADEEFALEDRQCHYTPLGHAEQDPQRAFQRLLTFDPPYYISLDYGNAANPLSREKSEGIVASDPFNAVNRDVHRLVLDSGRFEVLPGSRKNGIIVLRARS